MFLSAIRAELLSDKNIEAKLYKGDLRLKKIYCINILCVRGIFSVGGSVGVE